MEYDASDYIIPLPSLDTDKVVLMTLYVQRPAWQTRLGWLVPKWRWAKVIATGKPGPSIG